MQFDLIFNLLDRYKVKYEEKLIDDPTQKLFKKRYCVDIKSSDFRIYYILFKDYTETWSFDIYDEGIFEDISFDKLMEELKMYLDENYKEIK